MDFEKVIAAAMSAGETMEDIASKFTEAMNKAVGQKQEKKEAPTTREGMIKATMETLEKHFKGESLDLGDAAAIIWLSVLQDTDVGKDMEMDEMRELFDFISDDVGATVEKWEVFKAVSPVFDSVHGTICRCAKKGKHEAHNSDRKTDEEAIKSFLKGLFS